MCIGGRGYTPQQPAPVQLPPAPQINMSAPMMLQSTPAPARPANTTYRKKGKRALTIPQSNVNMPGS